MGKIFLKLGFFVLGVSFFIACKPSDDDSGDSSSSSDTQSTTDNNKQNTEWDDINSIVQNVMYEENSSLKTTAATCATVTVNNADSTIKIDFGTEGCLGTDGRTRKGVINVHYTGAYRDSGAVITTTLQDYYVNNNKVEGTKVVTNKGDNSSGNTYFTIEVTGGKITFENGDISTWTSSRTRTWVDGHDTQGLLYLSDDVYEVYGTASGVNINGLSYTMTVEQSDPLVIDIGCWLATVPSRQPKSGKLTISPEGLEDRVIDYSEGGGDCDNEVRVTIGVFSFKLVLI